MTSLSSSAMLIAPGEDTAPENLTFVPRRFRDEFLLHLQDEVLAIVSGALTTIALESHNLLSGTAFGVKRYIVDELRIVERLETLEWPSKWVPDDNRERTDPLIFGIYVPMLRSFETKRARAAIWAYIDAQIQWACLLAFRRQVHSEVTPKHGEPMSALRAHDFVVRFADDQASSVSLLDQLQTPFVSHNALKGEHPMAKLADQAIVSAFKAKISLQDPDNVEVVLEQKATAKKSTTKITTDDEKPADFVKRISTQFESRLAEMKRALRIDYARILDQVIEVSTHEALQVLPTYEDALRNLWSSTSEDYQSLLHQMDMTMPRLKQEFGAMLSDRIANSSIIFESYLTSAPLLKQQQHQHLFDNLEDIPTKRNYDLLYATEYGRFLVELYEAAQPILPRTANIKLPFLNQLPRFVTAFTLVPYRLEVMDRVHEFFAQRSQSVDYRENVDNFYSDIKSRAVAALAAAPPSKAAAAPRAKR